MRRHRRNPNPSQRRRECQPSEAFYLCHDNESSQDSRKSSIRDWFDIADECNRIAFLEASYSGQIAEWDGWNKYLLGPWNPQQAFGVERESRKTNSETVKE